MTAMLLLLLSSENAVSVVVASASSQRARVTFNGARGDSDAASISMSMAMLLTLLIMAEDWSFTFFVFSCLIKFAILAITMNAKLFKRKLLIQFPHASFPLSLPNCFLRCDKCLHISVVVYYCCALYKKNLKKHTHKQIQLALNVN